MRIKHWAGYGCINAKKVSVHEKGDSKYTTIELSGDHEWGLMPRCFTFTDWMRWLGKRFHLEDCVCIYTGDTFYKDGVEHQQIVFVEEE